MICTSSELINGSIIRMRARDGAGIEHIEEIAIDPDLAWSEIWRAALGGPKGEPRPAKEDVAVALWEAGERLLSARARLLARCNRPIMGGPEL